jgi:hypothetical protein
MECFDPHQEDVEVFKLPPPPLLTGHEPGDDETGQLSEGDGDDDVMLGGCLQGEQK